MSISDEIRKKRAEKARNWRAKNKDKVSQYDLNRRTEKRLQYKKNYKQKKEILGKEFVGEILKQSKCLDCGNNNPVVLDFDHRDPKTKINTISNMINAGYSVEKLKTEIAKCDCVCRNCHAIRTANMFGNWRLLIF